MNNTARVIYFSDRIDTYADCMIALLHKYSEIDRIELIFTDGSLAPQPQLSEGSSQPTAGQEQEEVTAAIRNTIKTASLSNSSYREAKNIPIVPLSVENKQLYRTLKTSAVIDVSAAPKEMAINLVTAAIAHSKTPVCSLRWIDKIKPGVVKRIGQDDYKYDDLTHLREARRLGKYYRANLFIIYFIAISVFILAVVSFLSYWFPQFTIVSQVLNSLGVVIGFTSLWLAIQAKRDD